MSESKIEWTERTWNPIVGCSILTPGCTNCYAMKMAARLALMGNAMHYVPTVKKVKGNAVWTGKLALAPDNILLEPLKREKPTTYFVNSMGDLFHEDCPHTWIDDVLAVAALCPHHTFQILTKRADRMRQYMTDNGSAGRQDVRNQLAWVAVPKVMNIWHPEWMSEGVDGPHRSLAIAAFTQWPLPNVWLGVSTERQQEADERIPHLLQTPAAVRFISAEPLLGPIDLTKLSVPDANGRMGPCNALTCHPQHHWPTLDWVIVGGESGAGSRPMHPDWARALRDQCAAAGVAYFFKQWGGWTPGENVKRQRGVVDTAHWFAGKWSFETENLANCEGHVDDQPDVYRVGKKEAGRHLDGNLHNAYPAAGPAASLRESTR